MTKMAVMPIYIIKPFKNHLLQNHWVDLDLFCGKVKFWNLDFSIGKSENSGFFKTIAAREVDANS